MLQAYDLGRAVTQNEARATIAALNARMEDLERWREDLVNAKLGVEQDRAEYKARAESSERECEETKRRLEEADAVIDDYGHKAIWELDAEDGPRIWQYECGFCGATAPNAMGAAIQHEESCAVTTRHRARHPGKEQKE